MSYMFPLNIPKLESQKANLVGNIFLIHRSFRSREGHGQQAEEKKNLIYFPVFARTHLHSASAHLPQCSRMSCF